MLEITFISPCNPGLITKFEIQLKQYSPSGEDMIESKIYDKGKAHYKTTTKFVDLRLETLNNAEEYHIQSSC